MRKIEEQMIAVIYDQRDNLAITGSSARKVNVLENTRIETGRREDGLIITNVFLHDNLIAQRIAPWQWGFKMCGWPTPTTKSRINALAQAFGREGVYTKNGKHYSGDREVNVYDWF